MRGDSDQWVYGTGVGKTEEAARRSALRELATRVLGQVKSTYRLSQTVTDGVSHTTSEAEFYSFSNVELETAQIDEVERSEGQVNVRMRIPSDTMKAMVVRSKRKAATLSLFGQIESTPAPTAVVALRLAMAGLEQAMKDQVLEERVKVQGRGIETFQQYFQYVVRQKRASLRLLVTPGSLPDDDLTLTLVETPSLMYQANAPLQVGTLQKTTNGQGVIRLPVKDITAQQETPVALDLDIRRLLDYDLLSDDDLQIDKILPPAGNPAMTRVYLHAHHRQVTTAVVVRIDGQPRYTNITVPAQIALAPGERYILHVVDSDQNKPVSKTISIPPQAADYYVSLPVEEKRYGTVDLQVASRSATITLEGPGGTVQETARIDHRALETGRYQVTVAQGVDPHYQQIKEAITVLPGETLERHYRAPRDREYYHFGYQLAASIWHLGRELSSDYQLPGNITYGDIQATNDVTLDNCTGPVGEGRYLTNGMNLMFQGELGIVWCNSDKGPSGVSKLEATIYTAGVGVGFYHRTDKHFWWLSGGLSQESLSWDRQQSTLVGLAKGSATNRYPFVEAGTMLGAFEVRLRVPTDKVGAMLSIGFGFHRMKEGYRYPAVTKPY